MKTRDEVMDIRHMMNVMTYLKESTVTDKGRYFLTTFDPTGNKEDEAYINQHADEIMKFMDDGYNAANLGNFEGCANSVSLKKNAIVVKIAFSENNEWIAISLYTGYQFGKKCIGITATTNPSLRSLGVEAVRAIIQEDASHPLDFYWCECSDAVAHLFEEYGGIKIRNEFVKEYINQEIVPDSWLHDGYYYTRKLRNGKEVTKVIFGFNRKETFDKVYAKYKAEIDTQLANLGKGTINEGAFFFTTKTAQEILGGFYWMTHQGGIGEFPQYYLSMVNQCMTTLKMEPKKTREIERTIELVANYLPYVTALEYHHYVGNESIEKHREAMVAESINK